METSETYFLNFDEILKGIHVCMHVHCTVLEVSVMIKIVTAGVIVWILTVVVVELAVNFAAFD